MDGTVFGMDPIKLGHLVGLAVLALIAYWRAK